MPAKIFNEVGKLYGEGRRPQELESGDMCRWQTPRAALKKGTEGSHSETFAVSRPGFSSPQRNFPAVKIPNSTGKKKAGPRKRLIQGKQHLGESPRVHTCAISIKTRKNARIEKSPAKKKEGTINFNQTDEKTETGNTNGRKNARSISAMPSHARGEGNFLQVARVLADDKRRRKGAQPPSQVIASGGRNKKQALRYSVRNQSEKTLAVSSK